MSGDELNYEVECRCGAKLRGRRTAQAQTPACSACGRRVYVLPLSPLPTELLGSLMGGTAPELPALFLAARRGWLGPTLAATAALVIVGLVIASIVQRYRPALGGRPTSTSVAAEQWSARLEAAQTAIGDGAYRTAAKELATAWQIHDRFPKVAVDDAWRSFRRMQRQVALLADLLTEPVETIARHSFGQSDAEWRAVFEERYAGRAVILDVPVFRDSNGRFHVDYLLDAGGVAGAWDLQNLTLLQGLPLQSPQRLFIGIRLAEVARISREEWVVRPQPDSGVLFTDETLLNGLSVAVDSDLRAVLRRQATWETD